MIRIKIEGDYSPSYYERRYIQNNEFDIETLEVISKIEREEDILNEINILKIRRQQ